MTVRAENLRKFQGQTCSLQAYFERALCPRPCHAGFGDRCMSLFEVDSLDYEFEAQEMTTGPASTLARAAQELVAEGVAA